MLKSLEIGEGTPVILVHGLAASLHDWDLVTPALVQAGCRLFAPDLPGHGDSPKPSDPLAYTIPALFLSFEQWIEQLDLRPPFHLVGHSLGGCLSLMLHQVHPEWIRSLTLISPLYRQDQLALPLRFFFRRPGVAARLLYRVPLRPLVWAAQRTPVVLNGYNLQSRRQVILDLKRASPLIANVSRQIPDLTPELERISVPTLLIWGESDLTLAPASFQQLALLLPSAQIHPIPRCGHQPHLSHSHLVNQWLLDLILASPL